MTYREYNGPWRKAWHAIAGRNQWIGPALRDPHDYDTCVAIHECKTPEELFAKFQHGNWSLGTGFSLGEVCFINQVNGGDEWLTIYRDMAFESMTARRCFLTPHDITDFCRAITRASRKDLVGSFFPSYDWEGPRGKVCS